MTNLLKGSKINLLVKKEGTGRGRVWKEKTGIVLEKNEGMILIQFPHYRESFMAKDFVNGLVKIKG